MKISTRYKIEIFIFLIITLFSLFIFRPFIRLLENKVTEARDALFQEIETVYGLKISYERLSPSLFRGLSLKYIKIFDAAKGTEIAAIEEMSIRYRLFALLKGNPAGLLDTVFIKNGFIDVDLLENDALVEKLSSLLAAPPSDTPEPAPPQNKQAFAELFSSGFDPLDLYVKNIQFKFKDAQQQLYVRVIEGLCVIDSEDISFSLTSAAAYRNAGFAALGPVDTKLSIEGKFEKHLTAGTCILDVSHLATSQFGVNSVKFFAGYRDGMLTVNSMQDVQPFDIKAQWNTQTNMMSCSFQCLEFMPLQWVTFYNLPKDIAKLHSLELSGGVHARFTNGALAWDSDIQADIPAFNVGGYQMSPSTVQLAAKGTDRVITVDGLSFKGSDAHLFTNFVLDLEKKLPSGKLNVYSVRLPTGEIVSGNAEFSEQGGRFVCRLPSLHAGGAELHNLRLSVTPESDQIGFDFQAEDEEGRYAFDGSYVFNEGDIAGTGGFLDIHAAFDAISVNNIYRFASGLYPQPMLPPVLPVPVQCTTEFYISTDFKNFSYNCIRLVLVSEETDGVYALFSLKGNQSSFSITDIDVLYNKISLKGAVNAEFEHLNDIIFDAALAVNEVGYQFQGFLAQNVLSVYGDYGLAVSAIYDEYAGVSGSLKVSGMPLPLLPLFLGLDTEFHYTNPESWSAQIYKGSVYYGTFSSIAQTALGLDFYGSVDPGGLFLHRVQLGSDEDSLSGSLIVNTPRMNPDGEGYRSDLVLTSTDSEEKLTVSALINPSNPLNANGIISVENVSLRRFLRTQGKRHRVSGLLSFAVSPEETSVECSIPSLSFFLAGKDLTAKTHLSFSNGTAQIADTEAVWGTHRIAGIGGDFSVYTLTGNLNADYTGNAAEKDLKTHLGIAFTGLTDPVFGEPLSKLLTRLPDAVKSFSVTATLSDWQFGDSSGVNEVPISVIREKDITALYAGVNDEITGFILNDGVVSLHLAETLPLSFNLDGSIRQELIDLNIRDINADIQRVWDITGLDYVRFYAGSVSGDLRISGDILEPEFNGKLAGRSIRVNSPHYIPEIFGPVDLDIIADGTVLEVPYVVLKGPSTNLWARCTAEFTQWIPANVSIQCGTLNNKLGILKTDNLLFKADGRAGCTAEILISPTLIGVYGSAVFDSGYFVFKFNDLDKFNAKYAGKNGPAFDMKLDLKMGRRAEFRWPSADFPILRTLIPTAAPLRLTVDGSTGTFFMKGQVQMRGGEVFYIKRSFYIREGSINFVDAGTLFEPLVTIRAEIRDRDTKGEPIRLILTAKDQPLAQFEPTLNSDPPRSSMEIMQLLGQVFIGDTVKENIWENILVSGSDLLAQIGFLKKAETAVRNFLRLDAFSFRTLLLQNAIFGNLFNVNTGKVLEASNYFDNTSVYVGKYFGSAIYADALLHLSHYDSKLLKDDGTKRPVYKNLLFQPEIGLEMSTPFFMLRWSLAPTRPDTLFVGDAALTFSWKYSY